MVRDVVTERPDADILDAAKLMIVTDPDASLQLPSPDIHRNHKREWIQVLDVFLENTGSSSLSISNIYFNGVQLTEWAYSSGTSYGTNLYVGNSGQSCFALVATSVTLTYSQAPTTLVSGISAEGCGTYTPASAVCNTVGTDFCITSSTATPPEAGMTAVPLAAQSSAQLIIGLNHGAAVTSGSSNTIKIVTTSGTQAVFSVVAGRTG